MVFVGLDLAGVPTRPTGFCILNGMQAQTADIYTDQEIIQKTLESCPEIIGIDAPLSLPAGRISLEDPNGPHLRPCDRELIKTGVKIFPMTLGPMRKLTKRGIMLREFFEAKGFRVLEVYPGGAQDVFGIPRKQKGIEKLLSGLQNLGITGLNNKMSDHELDATTAAYVCKLYSENKCSIYGSGKEIIVMPKK
jgi:predicted nuclease with RNAse H fold